MGLKFYNVGKAFCKGFAKLFYPYEVTNKNSIPDGMACIVCSNHLSYLDPVFINVTQKLYMSFARQRV